ncbi:MAG: sulfotransferase [Pseudomonadota bacterium]
MSAMPDTDTPQHDGPLRDAARPPRVIAGSGRGGTTWVLDALATANGLRPIFEPLHPQGVPRAARFAYACADGDAVPDGCEAFFADVFNGRLKSLWSDYRVRRDRLTPQLATLSSTTRVRQFYRRWRKLARNRKRYRPGLSTERCLVKLIRGNLMLDWLKRRFDARIVLIVRHPGAVVESQMRLSGSDWDPFRLLDAYTRQPAFKARYGARCAAVLDRQLTRAEAHAAVWCVENQLPLEAGSGASYSVVHYESLVEDPERQWPRMVEWLGLDTVPPASLVKRPSQQTSMASLDAALDQTRRPGWMERLPAIDSEQVQGVLSAFGVNAYRMDEPLPASAGAEH